MMIILPVQCYRKLPSNRRHRRRAKVFFRAFSCHGGGGAVRRYISKANCERSLSARNALRWCHEPDSRRVLDKNLRTARLNWEVSFNRVKPSLNNYTTTSAAGMPMEKNHCICSAASGGTGKSYVRDFMTIMLMLARKELRHGISSCSSGRRRSRPLSIFCNRCLPTGSRRWIFRFRAKNR